jgi:dihydrofolate reductase
MKLCFVVAVAENGVIGRDNALPWRLPSDLRRFKAITMGKPLIMGRRTFDSIGRPLPGRVNIVVTRDPSFSADGVIVVHDIAGALAAADAAAQDAGVTEVMVIGGAAIYDAMLESADRVYLTEVHDSPDGDTGFPPLDRNHWREVSREFHRAEPGETSDCSFVVLDRRGG